MCSPVRFFRLVRLGNFICDVGFRLRGFAGRHAGLPLQFILYFFCRGEPMCSPVFFVFVSLGNLFVTLVLVYGEFAGRHAGLPLQDTLYITFL